MKLENDIKISNRRGSYFSFQNLFGQINALKGHLKKIYDVRGVHPYIIISPFSNEREYLISAFTMEKTHSRTLFLHFQQYKTPDVPYFSILKRLNPQPYIVLEFSLV